MVIVSTIKIVYDKVVVSGGCYYSSGTMIIKLYGSSCT